MNVNQIKDLAGQVQNFATRRLPGFADVENWLRGEWTVRDSQTRKKICEFDTFISYSARKTSSVPSNQIEQGSFAAYNKINNPAEFSVTLAKSGSSTVLNSVLVALNDYSESTKLVDLVLPFRTYKNLNVVSVSHGISEGAAVNLLVVELTLKEIKQTARQYTSLAMPASNVKNAGDADTVNSGRQQAKQPDAALMVQIENKIKEWFK
ncbi:MAG: hypothetical protein KHX55_02530 [Proteobacteria bacterium]|nr:hypothetical protein [Pseudomonadota bacterium]